MIKTIKKYSSLLPTIFLPSYVKAAGSPRITLPENTSPDIKTYLLSILTIITSIATALAVLFVVIGGLQYMTAGGDEKKTAVAKKTLTYAIIGLLLVILSFTIINIVNQFANKATN